MLHGTREQCKESKQFLLRGFHPLWPNFPDRSNTDHLCNSFGLKQQSTHCPTTPRCNACKLSHRHGLGSSPFAHHYLGNHYYFLFLRVMRCFSSPRPLKQTMYSSEYCTKCRVVPFGNLRIKGCLLLPVAYRSLPRPSSVANAKASVIRPLYLNL